MRIVTLATAALTAVVALLAASVVGWILQARGLETISRAQAMWLGALVAALLAPVVFGPLVALVVRQRAMGRLLRAAALSDPLTGIPNRRAFFEAARLWLGDAASPRAFALLMVDVDHFKAVNDRFGHEAGDAALVHVAATLRGVFAEARHGAALVARLGGEEFAVFLDESGPTGARRAAEAVVAAMRLSPFRWRGEAVPLTGSVGVWWGRADGIDRPLAEADDAVYRAKAAGRDRWEPAQGARDGVASRVRLRGLRG